MLWRLLVFCIMAMHNAVPDLVEEIQCFACFGRKSFGLYSPRIKPGNEVGLRNAVAAMEFYFTNPAPPAQSS